MLLMPYQRYRMLLGATLIMLVAAAAPALAEDDWPDYIDPPMPMQQAAPAAVDKAESPNDDQKSGLKKWWPFGKRDGKGKAQPLREEQIVNIGPRETQPSTNPLLRLPVALDGNEGEIPAGFYLVEARIKDGLFVLYRERQQVAVIPISDVAMLAAASSPIEPVQPKPPTPQVVLKWSPDQRSVKLRYEFDGQTYESRLLPVVTDRRKELGF